MRKARSVVLTFVLQTWAWPTSRGADLKGAYLQGAYLTGADLPHGGRPQGGLPPDCRPQVGRPPEADLEGADLKRADLQGVDLSQVLGLTKEQIESAIRDDKTKLPDRLRPSPRRQRAPAKRATSAFRQSPTAINPKGINAWRDSTNVSTGACSAKSANVTRFGLFTLDLSLPSSHRVHGASSFLRWVDVHLTQPNSTTGGLSVNFQLSLAYPRGRGEQAARDRRAERTRRVSAVRLYSSLPASTESSLTGPSGALDVPVFEHSLTILMLAI